MTPGAALIVALAVLAALTWPTRAGLLEGRLLSGRPSRQPPGRALARWRLRGRSAETGLGPTDLLMVLDALAPALRAGLPVPTALQGVSGLALRTPAVVSLVQRLTEQAERADPLSEVFAEAAGESSELVLVAHAWRLSERTGAPIADAVDSATRLVREAVAQQRRVQAALAPARATIRLLTALPLAGPLLGLAVGVDPAGLAGQPTAWVCACGGLFLLWLGRLWVGRQVASAVRSPAVP